MSDVVKAGEIAQRVLQHSLERRRELLDEMCGGDAALRTLAEQQLDSTASTQAIGDHRANHRSTVATDDADRSTQTLDPSRHLPPPTIGSTQEVGPESVIAGKFRLRKVIGEGGMGAVWLADQTEPVKRQVAVKLIKAGIDSRQVVARFEAERQALAMMDHPHIAKILDGGSLEQSQTPFFVMEYVPGVPITRYCDDQRLPPRERLELFVPICDAIQHAHQKGIIHRDIKPSNILVSDRDGRPTPKVIDFGVAKATGGALTDKTLQTVLGAVVGTPQYMSPEQADTDEQDIDTRSDVYSLGVLLYELLTGSPPFDPRKLGRPSLLEILRIIREVDPPTPSSKLDTDEGLPTISANRQMEPVRLTRLVRGELDWIVMKALEKDRTRRYESASGLAADIRRYLAGEPVLAAPPSRAYQLRKFLRRHRGVTIATGLVALSLVAGIVGTSLGLVKARAERASAVLARNAEAEQRRQAETATARAFVALQSFTDEFVERQFASKLLLSANDRAILTKALLQWQQFANAQGTSQQAREIQSEGLYRVAKLRFQLGDSSAAEPDFRRASEILRTLIAEFPNDPKYVSRLTSTQVGLGSLLHKQRRLDESIREIDAALTVIAPLAKADPNSSEIGRMEASAWSARGVVMRALGMLDEAQEAYHRALAIQERTVAQDPTNADSAEILANSHNNQGNLLLAQGDWEQAEHHFRAGLALRVKLCEQYPEGHRYRADLAYSHYGLGDSFNARADHPNALKEYQTALAGFQQLHDEYPLVADYRINLGNVHINVGVMLGHQGDVIGAMRQYEQTVEVMSRLARDYPEVAQFQVDLARGRNKLATSWLTQGKTTEALEQCELAQKSLEGLVAAQPSDIEFRTELAICLDNRAGLDERRGQIPAALSNYESALRMLEQTRAESPESPKLMKQLLDANWHLGSFHSRQRNFSNAVEAFQPAIALAEQRYAQRQGLADSAIPLLELRMELAVALEQQGKLPEARAAWQRAIEFGESAVPQNPRSALLRIDLAGAYTNCSLLLGRMNDPAKSAAQLDSATRLLEQVVEEFPNNMRARIQWCGNLVNQAHVRQAAKEEDQALQLLDQAVELLEPIVRGGSVDRSSRAYLHNALHARARIHDGRRTYVEAARDWGRMAELVDPSADQIVYRSKSAQSLVRAGEVVRALEIVESLSNVDQPPTIFARARVLALAYGMTQNDAHAAGSIRLIRQLVTMGFNDADRLKSDPDLTSLRDRPDFTALIAEIEAK